jgi:hypothetical protein
MISLCEVSEASESIGRQLGVPDGVLDVAVAEVVLDRPRVVALIGELEAAGMTQYVRMHWEAEIRLIAGSSDDCPN